MPTRHRLDEIHGAMWVIFEGAVRCEDVDQIAELMRHSPEHDPKLDLIVDLRAARCLDLSTQEIRALSRQTHFLPGVRKAVIAPNDLIYGIARMYEQYASVLGQQIRVFRDAPSACAWLGIPDIASTRTSPSPIAAMR